MRRLRGSFDIMVNIYQRTQVAQYTQVNYLSGNMMNTFPRESFTFVDLRNK